jgi:hypothetical protein
MFEAEECPRIRFHRVQYSTIVNIFLLRAIPLAERGVAFCPNAQRSADMVASWSRCIAAASRTCLEWAKPAFETMLGIA